MCSKTNLWRLDKMEKTQLIVGICFSLFGGFGVYSSLTVLIVTIAEWGMFLSLMFSFALFAMGFILITIGSILIPYSFVKEACRR